MEVDTEKKEEEEEETEKPASSSSKAKERAAEMPERKSARQRAKEDQEDDLRELPVENIDWDKISPQERVRMKDKYLRKERDLMDLIDQLQHGQAIYPIGRDRCFRRYWTFRCIPGLFVEDQEEHIPCDFLVPVEQQVQETFQSDSLPLSEKMDKPSGEEKSTSSDKENDSFDHGKSEEPVVESIPSENGQNPLRANAANKTTRLAAKEAAKDDTEIKAVMKPLVVCQSVHEQIEASNSVRWSFFHTPAQLDKLIDSLNMRGYREGQLKQVLLEQKSLLEESINKCPVSQLNLAQAEEEKASAKSVKFQSLKSRNKTTQGVVNNASANELLELNLRESLLDLEERIFIGTLGALKVS